jgi:DNA-binding ferritin-like protein (Dps family)
LKILESTYGIINIYINWGDKKVELSIFENLNEKNKSIYNDMVTYIKLCKLTKKDKQRCIDAILSDFSSIENDDKTIDELIGTGYKEYCESIINKVTQDTSKIDYYLDKIRESSGSLILGTGVYYLVQSFMLIKKNNNISLDLQINSNILLLISLVVIMMHIAMYAINKETKKRCFDINKNFIKNQGAILLTLSAFILYIILGIITKIIPNIMINIPIYIVIGLILIMYLIPHILISKK